MEDLSLKFDAQTKSNNVNIDYAAQAMDAKLIALQAQMDSATEIHKAEWKSLSDSNKTLEN